MPHGSHTFSSLDNYRDSTHYQDSFTTTIVIVKFLLSLSTKHSTHLQTQGHIILSALFNQLL